MAWLNNPDQRVMMGFRNRRMGRIQVLCQGGVRDSSSWHGSPAVDWGAALQDLRNGLNQWREQRRNWGGRSYPDYREQGRLIPPVISYGEPYPRIGKPPHTNTGRPPYQYNTPPNIRGGYPAQKQYPSPKQHQQKQKAHTPRPEPRDFPRQPGSKLKQGGVGFGATGVGFGATAGPSWQGHAGHHDPHRQNGGTRFNGSAIPGNRPRSYQGSDGALYEFTWSRDGSLRGEVKLKDDASSAFEGTVQGKQVTLQYENASQRIAFTLNLVASEDFQSLAGEIIRKSTSGAGRSNRIVLNAVQ